MAKETNTAGQWAWLMGPIKVSERGHAIIFTFIGRNKKGDLRKLSLNYNARTRHFGASYGTSPLNKKWEKLARQADDLVGALGEQVNATGKLRDLLKAQLKPEHIAMCTALTINGGRT